MVAVAPEANHQDPEDITTACETRTPMPVDMALAAMQAPVPTIAAGPPTAPHYLVNGVPYPSLAEAAGAMIAEKLKLAEAPEVSQESTDSSAACDMRALSPSEEPSPTESTYVWNGVRHGSMREAASAMMAKKLKPAAVPEVNQESKDGTAACETHAAPADLALAAAQEPAPGAAACKTHHMPANLVLAAMDETVTPAKLLVLAESLAERAAEIMERVSAQQQRMQKAT